MAMWTRVAAAWRRHMSAEFAATLLEHYPDFRNRPHLLRAHLMASAILHSDEVTPTNNTVGGRNDYGLGRVSDYQSHWARLDPNGWSGHWAWMTITDKSWGFFDINVPRGAKRVVAVLTWDEPEASAGASQAVTYDVDLWADPGASCTPDFVGQCGAWASQSNIDNVEYLIIDNPPAGVLRLKAINWRAPSFGLPVAIAAKIIRWRSNARDVHGRYSEHDVTPGRLVLHGSNDCCQPGL